jgi:hypothetical protein
LPGMKYNTKDCYLRSQRTLNVFGYPLKYNPNQKTLVIYNNFNVNIEFQNPTTAINIDNGLFNKIAKNALLNFSSNNIPSIPSHPPPTKTSVTWKTLNSCDDADQIVADYLIITHDQFFTPHSMALQRLANHKATLNGFDVVIVNVPNILDPTFNWTIDAGPPEWAAEKKIREFIRRVFVGAHALHTYDGKLAFVCLVGDTDEDLSENYVPASFDPNPTGSALNLVYWAYNDYYYSCLTKTNGLWDLTGDLYIGRISARTETELDNYVTKLKYNENEFTSQTWRGHTVLSYGSPFSGNLVAEHSFWTTDLKNYLDNICPSTFHTEVVDANALNTQWNITYANYLNTEGANVVVHHGHGTPESWRFGGGQPEYQLSNSFKIAHLNNTAKFPIALANSCLTGSFSGPTAGGMGEVLTTYSSAAGYVGYLGATIEILAYQYNLPFAQDQNFFTRFLTALYANQSHVMGEAVLEARTYCVGLGINDKDYLNFQYNWFGDPAYNCMTPGYEITHNLSLPPAPPASQTIAINNPVYIRSGAKLTLNHNAEVEFGQQGQLIVDEGGVLEIYDGTKIKGMNLTNKIIVNGLLTGPNGTLSVPTPIVGLELDALPGCSWGGIEFNNPEITVKLTGCSVKNCMLTGSLYKLETVNNTVFDNVRIGLTNSGLSLISNSVIGTNISVSNPQAGSAQVEILNSNLNGSADGMISLDHVSNFKIQNCTITYDHGTGIDLHYSGWNGTNNAIDQNYIQKSGDPHENSWGIMIYNSKASITQNQITNNRYGLSCLNSSQTKIMGNANATTLGATQQIKNNFQNQIRSFDNSFPWYVHYNELKNNLQVNSYLIYHDNSVLPDPGGNTDYSGYFNVKCNCFDNNTNPAPQLYPVGAYQYLNTWCAGAFCVSGQENDDTFVQAMAAMDSGNYVAADSLFRTVIATSSGTDRARESAKNLIPVTRELSMDFSSLKNYYAQTPALHTDSITDHLVYRLMNACDLCTENYDSAVAWFENDILNPASVEDSVYSLIDLSDTYLLMEADSGLKATTNNVSGTLTQYIPKNHQEYVTRRQDWINLLFKDDSPNLSGNESSFTKDYELSQNNPNPFTTTTEISFVAPKDGSVLITVTNMIGQTVFLENRNILAGNNKIMLNLSSSTDGVYLVSFIFDNQVTKKIKVIKQKK